MLWRRNYTTIYDSYQFMLYKIQLQGCKVDSLESAGHDCSDDIIIGRGTVGSIISTLLTLPVDEWHTHAAGR